MSLLKARMVVNESKSMRQRVISIVLISRRHRRAEVGRRRRCGRGLRRAIESRTPSGGGAVRRRDRVGGSQRGRTCRRVFWSRQYPGGSRRPGAGTQRLRSGPRLAPRATRPPTTVVALLDSYRVGTREPSPTSPWWRPWNPSSSTSPSGSTCRPRACWERVART